MCVYVGLGSTVVTSSQTTSNNAETEYRLVKLTDKVKKKNNRCMHIVFIMCVFCLCHSRPLIATRVAIVTVFLTDPADTLSHIKGIYDSKLNLP